MRCEVGSCQAKATFTLSHRPDGWEPDEYEADSRWTCGRHVASVLTAMLRAYDAVTVARTLQAAQSYIEPRSVPRGTPGRELAPSAVSGDAAALADSKLRHPSHRQRRYHDHACPPGCPAAGDE